MDRTCVWSTCAHFHSNTAPINTCSHQLCCFTGASLTSDLWLRRRRRTQPRLWLLQVCFQTPETTVVNVLWVLCNYALAQCWCQRCQSVSCKSNANIQRSVVVLLKKITLVIIRTYFLVELKTHVRHYSLVMWLKRQDVNLKVYLTN